jgi:hypothetical protein
MRYDAPIPKEKNRMIAKKLILCCTAIVIAGQAFAQVELKTYGDPDGYLDVQKLTCAQLANTFQEDADYLAAWYSGWYNGLAKKHVMQVSRAKSLQHEVIVYCKANPGKKVIEAIDVVFKDSELNRASRRSNDLRGCVVLISATKTGDSRFC